MILVEKRVLIEGKDYLSMAILQKRNFKGYSRRLKYKNYKNKRKFYKSKRARLRIRSALRRLNKDDKRLLLLKLWRLSYSRRYLLKYLRRRVDSIRIKAKLYKYSHYVKRRMWKLRYKRIYKRFYRQLLFSKLRRHPGYSRLVYRFYVKYGVSRLLKNFVKYAFLKARLRRRGKVFKKKAKRLSINLSRDRAEILNFLSLFTHFSIFKGRKKASFKLLHKVFLLLKYKYKRLFVNSYIGALDKIRPLLFYRIMFIGGKKYKIPVLMPISKSYRVGLRWLLKGSREAGGEFAVSIVDNINTSLKGDGAIVKNRRDYHLQSFENRTYIRFLRFLKSGF